MSSVVETYWQRTFADYQVSARSFFIPDYPNPIMSADFGRTNFIESTPCETSKMTFRLGVLDITPESQCEQRYTTRPLSQGIGLDHYQDLLEKCFTNQAVFLMNLSHFLITTKAQYLNLTLENNNEVVAMTNLAISGDIALLFNGCVDPRYQKQGFAYRLIRSATSEALQYGAKQVFFWTTHEALLRYANRHYYYNIKTVV